jgi:putative transposase
MAEKKSMNQAVEQKRQLIEPDKPQISIRRQCELVGLNRASYYYQGASESALNLELMRQIDEQYLKTPFYGWPRMTAYLQRQGYQINHKRVQRLMRKMGIQAIYPRPRPNYERHEHKIYPYLLKGLQIERPNQVWSTDITYIPLQNGFMYLVAVIDWYSRYILSWQLSNTLDGHFCQVALQQALSQGQPEIFNTDQGVQFTATDFTNILQQAQIKISMDGRGRALDNIFIERFWRSLKYEDIYVWEYATVPDLWAGLQRYFRLYNLERLHQSLGYRTPAEVHFAQNPTVYVN